MPPSGPAPVAVVEVQPQSVPVTLEYAAQTAGSREAEVRARVTGILLRRKYTEGSTVKAGESLFTIDPAPFEAALAKVQADVVALEARSAQAKREATRLKPLYESGAVSQKVYDDAVSAEAITAADAQAAQARLKEARLNLEYTRVEAPITGVAGRALKSEGNQPTHLCGGLIAVHHHCRSGRDGQFAYLAISGNCPTGGDCHRQLSRRLPRAVMSGAIARELVAITTPTLDVPAGLPSELLLRRPDILVAEQKLIAENARIGAVRAQVFPAITLTAFLGSESATLSDLFSGPAGIYQFASNLIQPLFNAGRLKHAQAAAQARRDQALASYRMAVANAFADVRRALAAQESARAILGFNGQRTNALHQAYQQATRRHEGGLISRVDLLDIERQRLQAELTHVNAALAQRVAAIDLIKALGGGWSPGEAQAVSP